MKKFIFLFVIALIALPVFSQDVIVKVNNETINCKILGRKNRILEYQLAGSSEVYSIPLKEVQSFKTVAGGSNANTGSTSTATNYDSDAQSSETAIESSMNDSPSKSYYSSPSPKQKSDSRAEKRFRIGVKGGLNMSNMTGLDNNMNIADMSEFGIEASNSSSYEAGFHAGLVFQFDVTPHFFIQPELLYSMQNMKAKSSLVIDDESLNITEKKSLQYIQMPVYAGYKINMGPKSNFILGVGPYVGYGVSGKSKINGSGSLLDPLQEELGIPFEGEGDPFRDNGSLKRFDFGLSALAGIQFNNRFQITVGYDLGLIDISNYSNYNNYDDEGYGGLTGISTPSFNNRNFKASVAVFF